MHIYNGSRRNCFEIDLNSLHYKLTYNLVPVLINYEAPMRFLYLISSEADYAGSKFEFFSFGVKYSLLFSIFYRFANDSI